MYSPISPIVYHNPYIIIRYILGCILFTENSKIHLKMSGQYYNHSDFYCDITISLAIKNDLQLRSILALLGNRSPWTVLGVFYLSSQDIYLHVDIYVSTMYNHVDRQMITQISKICVIESCANKI